MLCRSSSAASSARISRSRRVIHRDPRVFVGNGNGQGLDLSIARSQTPHVACRPAHGRARFRDRADHAMAGPAGYLRRGAVQQALCTRVGERDPALGIAHPERESDPRDPARHPLGGPWRTCLRPAEATPTVANRAIPILRVRPTQRFVVRQSVRKEPC